MCWWGLKLLAKNRCFSPFLFTFSPLSNLLLYLTFSFPPRWQSLFLASTHMPAPYLLFFYPAGKSALCFTHPLGRRPHITCQPKLYAILYILTSVEHNRCLKYIYIYFYFFLNVAFFLLVSFGKTLNGKLTVAVVQVITPANLMPPHKAN